MKKYTIFIWIDDNEPITQGLYDNKDDAIKDAEKLIEEDGYEIARSDLGYHTDNWYYELKPEYEGLHRYIFVMEI